MCLARLSIAGLFFGLVKVVICFILREVCTHYHEKVSKNGMPAGRPTKYDPSMCDDARAFMAEGYSKEALAGKFGIAVRTLCDWQERYPQFLQAIKEGEAQSQTWWEDRGRDACVDGNFNATVWAMNMKNRFGWRDRVDHEHTGKDGGPIESKVIQVVGVDADSSS